MDLMRNKGGAFLGAGGSALGRITAHRGELIGRKK